MRDCAFFFPSLNPVLDSGKGHAKTVGSPEMPNVVATIRDDLGLRQVCGHGDPFARVGSIFTWTEHRVALLAQRLGPELYDQRLRGATRCARYSLEKGHLGEGP